MAMSTSLAAVLGFTSVPALAVINGGTVAAVRSAVQHLASGVLFAALATQLLPEVMHRRMPLVAVFGFVAGVAAMLGLKPQRRVGRPRKASQVPARCQPA